MQSIALARWIIHCLLVQLLLFVADTRTRLIRFVIDEELSQGTPIGSLLDHVPGSYDNLKFVKLTNTEDASALFAVDEFSGELTVAARLDRETLCLVSSSTPVSSTDRVAGRSTIGFEWTHPNVAIPCELRFSINCLSASSSSSSLVPVGGILVVLFDIVVTLRDINDNGCTFYPSDRQIIHLNEDAPVGKTTVPLHFPFDPDDAKLGHAVRQDSIHIVLGRPNEQSVIPGPRYVPSDLFKLNILPIHSNGSFSTFSSTDKHSINFRLELELIHTLDYEQQQNFTFDIIANDNVISAKHQCKLSVTVLIDDCNDNSPVFEKTLYTSNISENTPVGTLITQLRAKDADSGPQGTVFYRIHGSSDQSAAYFHLNSSTGKLRLQKRLNYAHKSLHVLDILAENDVTNSRCHTSTTSQQRAFTRVQLQVIDVNDQAPKIRIFSPAGSNKLEVLEESPAGQDFAIVDVTDEDTGENAKVECMVGNRSLSKTLKMTPVESESDDPDKGTRQKRRYKLTLSKSLDREKMQMLDFTILCWDKGSPSLTSEIPGTLSLVDVNDNPPKFAKSNYHVMITEDSDPDRTRHNFEFLTVSAMDPDAGVNSKIRYSLDPGMRKSLLSLIKIDPNSGVLSTTGSLDRELVEQLTFRVFATDMGTPQKSSHAVVTVQVLDYNDNAPKFSKSAYNFDLVENSPVGHLIGSLSLSDSDIDKNAEVKVKIEENFERTKQHSSSLLNQPDLFEIGGLSSSSGYKIHTPPSHSVPMSPQIRLVTFQVPHISKDAGERSNQTMYEIQLYTTSVWDREAFLPGVKNLLTDEFFGNSGTNFASYWKNQNLFNHSRADPIIVVKVQAEDQGKPRLVSQTLVQIRVRDINDNSPTFLFPNPKNFNLTRITLSNREPKGFIFAQIFAFDEDAGENGTVQYFIESGNAEQLFRLDPLTGELSVDEKFNHYITGEYLLHLEARDCGQPYRSSFVRLIIDVDDSAPKGLLASELYGGIGGGLFGGSGGAGNTFNLYILIAIVSASCLISALLLSSIFFLLRRSRRSRRGVAGRRISRGNQNGETMGTLGLASPNSTKFQSSWSPSPQFTGNGTDTYGQIYTASAYPVYPNTLNGNYGLNQSDDDSLLMKDPKALRSDQKQKAYYHPYICSLGNMVTYGDADHKRENIEFYIPSGQNISSVTMGEAGAHVFTNDSVPFAQTITCTGTMQRSSDFRNSPLLPPPPTLSGYLNTQLMHSPESGRIFIGCSTQNQTPPDGMQHGFNLLPSFVGSPAAAAAAAAPLMKMESSSVQSADCDSGHGDSLDVIQTCGLNFMGPQSGTST